MTNDFSMRLSAQVRPGNFRAAGRPLAFALAAGLMLLGGCSGDMSSDSKYPSQTGSGPTNPNPTGERQTIFGTDGISLFGGGDDKATGQGIGVNSFLWRASLDTVSFMPLASADPFGGVIITDWYQDPRATGERFKVTVYIMDRRLRADGIKVAVFRQKQDGANGWVDSPTDTDTAIKIENAILVRARQLRISSVEAGDAE
jgi:hypothetical protein